jgi:glycoprotein 6-alpha-L-fucosyltransferase
MLQSTVTGFGIERPMVGIHIRRTDKVGTEAAFHPVEEYMKYVEEWFRHYELTHPLKTRRVYVASDDPKVLGECRKKYPEIAFIGDQNVAKSAAVSSRYTDSSLRGVIQDIHMLSISDFLVCTFSSQVCRIAYELMQQHHVDASDRFKSLDDNWYYGGQDEHQQEAVLRHEVEGRSGEISLEVGDVLGVAGNHWNGFNKGRNHRTNRVGLYPEYKTKEKLRIVNFPKYAAVKTP